MTYFAFYMAVVCSIFLVSPFIRGLSSYLRYGDTGSGDWADFCLFSTTMFHKNYEWTAIFWPFFLLLMSFAGFMKTMGFGLDKFFDGLGWGWSKISTKEVSNIYNSYRDWLENLGRTASGSKGNDEWK